MPDLKSIHETLNQTPILEFEGAITQCGGISNSNVIKICTSIPSTEREVRENAGGG